MHILTNPPLNYIFSIADMVKKDKIHELSVENQSDKKNLHVPSMLVKFQIHQGSITISPTKS